MKTKGRPWQFFVVAVLIVLFAFTAFFGVSTQYGDTTKIWIKGAQNIRFGIDTVSYTHLDVYKRQTTGSRYFEDQPKLCITHRKKGDFANASSNVTGKTSINFYS